MTVKKIEYFVTRFYPDKKGFFELPEGSLLSLIGDDYVTALVPVAVNRQNSLKPKPGRGSY